MELPPLARGKLVYHQAYLHLSGITPAGAGKTGLEGNLAVPIWNYPRWRGENFLQARRYLF